MNLNCWLLALKDNIQHYFILNFHLQLQVQAYDVAYPLDRAVTNVTITIRRNENAPQFDQFQYSANISENTARNVVVLRLNATDRDVGVKYMTSLFFSLKG